MKKYLLFVILVILLVIFSIATPTFMTFNNIMNILLQNAYLIIAATGTALVMMSGGTDLSIGYLISVVSVTTAAFIEWAKLPLGLALVLGLLIGMLLGAINGLAANILNIHPMIVTLATMTLYQGVSFIISGSKSIYNLPAEFKWIGQGYIGPVPVAVILFIIIAIIVEIVLKKTYFGRYVYAVGGNPEASRLNGIDVKKVKLIVFIIAGFLGAISAFVLVGRAGSANSTMGPGTEFNAITACVLGGVSFVGGEGEEYGLVLGVIILGVLSNGMQLVGLGIYVQYVVKGLILLMAIGWDTYQKTAKVKKVQVN